MVSICQQSKPTIDRKKQWARVVRQAKHGFVGDPTTDITLLLYHWSILDLIYTSKHVRGQGKCILSGVSHDIDHFVGKI